MDNLLYLENSVVFSLGWPRWACRSIVSLTSLVAMLFILQSFIKPKGSKANSVDSNVNSNANKEFRSFQLQYLAVYFIIMLADWLQGTNMYTLYSSYGVDIATLFLTGFLSSAVFGTIVGVFVDKWGRKNGCILFCVLEIVINLLEHVPSMPVLMLSRIMGGISTSLLFVTFESWMVSAHRKRGYSEELLNHTFAIASYGNGITAIVAGIMAQYAFDLAGDIGPFQLAIALTVIALVLIIPWEENYGNNDSNNHENTANKVIESNVIASMVTTISWIIRHPQVMLLGLSQSFFEGAIYTFVFLWVPVLLNANHSSSESLPTGLIFSSFMLALTIGGMIAEILLDMNTTSTTNNNNENNNNNSNNSNIIIINNNNNNNDHSHDSIVKPMLHISYMSSIIAALTMIIPAYNSQFHVTFLCFLGLESVVGIYYAIGGNLRSKYYPESRQSSIMSVFRLPLNILVVCGTKLTDYFGGLKQYFVVFQILAVVHICVAMLQIMLLFAPSGKQHSNNDNNNHKKRD